MTKFLIETKTHPETGQEVPIMVLPMLVRGPSGTLIRSYGYFVNERYAGEVTNCEVAHQRAAFLVTSGAMDLPGLL